MWEPTLEQIRDLLWPKSPRTGKSSWKPSKHDRALNQALGGALHCMLAANWPCGPTYLQSVTGAIPSSRQSAETEVSR